LIALLSLSTISAGRLPGRADAEPATWLDAQQALAALIEIDPAQRVSAFPKLLFRRSEDYAKMVDGLRMAGVPE
jgi:hypothetical protein